MNLRNLLSCFLEVLFPKICFLCGRCLVVGEDSICLTCLWETPKTNYHLQKDNPIEKRFWGKIPVEFASSYLFFEKELSVQKLMHLLKYKGEKEIGLLLGRYFGAELRVANLCSDIDLIVPVPLHKNRMRKRGYNQSEWIAKGLSDALKKPLDTTTLIRTIENPTQTHKGVFERWENTLGVFKVLDKSQFEKKHILLIDDVLTTGSTLEACAQSILQVAETKISIVTLAVAV